MPHPLDDSREKLARARAQLQELTQTVEAFLGRDPYELVHRDDPQTGERVVSVRVKEEPPSGRIAAIIGDIGHNLRSALDYVAHQFVLVNGQTPTHATEFPIFAQAAQYTADTRRKTRGMSAQAIALIRSLQPFAWQTPLDRHPLWILHELNNADKHRELSVVGNALQSQNVTITSNVQVAVRPAAPISLGAPPPIIPIQDGTELMRIAIVAGPPGGGAALTNAQFGFGISFRSPPIVRGKPVVALMNDLVDFVDTLLSSDEIRALFP